MQKIEFRNQNEIDAHKFIKVKPSVSLPDNSRSIINFKLEGTTILR